MKSKFKSAKSFEERAKDAAQIKHEEWDLQNNNINNNDKNIL